MINITLAVGLAWWFSCVLQAFILIKEKRQKKVDQPEPEKPSVKRISKEEEEEEEKHWREIDTRKHDLRTGARKLCSKKTKLIGPLSRSVFFHVVRASLLLIPHGGCEIDSVVKVAQCRFCTIFLPYRIRSCIAKRLEQSTHMSEKAHQSKSTTSQTKMKAWDWLHL